MRRREEAPLKKEEEKERDALTLALLISFHFVDYPARQCARVCFSS